jgi:hypothetical protein
MKRKIIFILSLIVVLTACNSQKEMTGIKLYPQLEKIDLSNSIELSVDDFFQRRMKNREYENVMGKRCEILFFDSNFVYWGYPYIINGVRKADTIFKTQIQVLTKQFSLFKNIEGYHIKNKIIKSLQSYFDIALNYTVLSTKSNWEFHLEADKMKVCIEFISVQDFIIRKKQNFTIELDKSSLEIISIKKL